MFVCRGLADQLEGNEEEHGKYRSMVVQYIMVNAFCKRNFLCGLKKKPMSVLIVLRICFLSTVNAFLLHVNVKFLFDYVIAILLAIQDMWGIFVYISKQLIWFFTSPCPSPSVRVCACLLVCLYVLHACVCYLINTNLQINLILELYLQNTREMFEPFIEDDVPFDEYCQLMEKDGTWAGHMELQAASLVTHSNICVHRVRFSFSCSSHLCACFHTNGITCKTATTLLQADMDCLLSVSNCTCIQWKII